jgi:hypothetical protein
MSNALKPNLVATSALYEKYRFIPRVVANLDSNQLSHMFRTSADPLTFFPTIGLFAHEFALGYCFNQSLKRQLNAHKGGPTAYTYRAHPIPTTT